MENDNGLLSKIIYYVITVTGRPMHDIYALLIITHTYSRLPQATAVERVWSVEVSALWGLKNTIWGKLHSTVLAVYLKPLLKPIDIRCGATEIYKLFWKCLENLSPIMTCPR